FLLAIISLGWTAYTHFKLLPLQQANLVFLEKDIMIQNIKKTEYEMYDRINSTITNTGKASAQNIEFSIYSMYFNKNILLYGEEVKEFFYNSKILNELPGGESVSFGVINIPYYINGIDGQVALIYHLKYIDSLTPRDLQNKIFWLQYPLGGYGASGLIKDDYEKIYDRLLKYFENKKEDTYILEFLRKNSPKRLIENKSSDVFSWEEMKNVESSMFQKIKLLLNKI
ncbi:MAG: hypothetical protein PHT16_04100, partial [Candidatus Pacebacteria bacterium]|nr:hypothetical protein [Candidatus Paceibacterota bacterium]